MRYGRDRGKKFATWSLDVEGRRFAVEVRSVDGGTRFWVTMPEHGIDVEDVDLAKLKSRVSEILAKRTPIEWRDHLVVTLCEPDEDGGFPTMTVREVQLGQDGQGKRCHRDGDRRSVEEGWPVSGQEGQSWRGVEVLFVVEKTEASATAVARLMQAARGCFELVAQIMGGQRTRDGRWKVDEAALRRALEALASRPVDFAVQPWGGR